MSGPLSHDIDAACPTSDCTAYPSCPTSRRHAAPAPVWPDEATVERAKEAMYRAPSGYDHQARAALSTVDPSRDTVLLGQVRAEVEKVEAVKRAEPDIQPLMLAAHEAQASRNIAALLAGGEG